MDKPPWLEVGSLQLKDDSGVFKGLEWFFYSSTERNPEIKKNKTPHNSVCYCNFF